MMMHRYLLATAAALTLSTASAMAAGPDATTTVSPATSPPAAASGYYGYYSSGYLFPDDGSPSGDEPMVRPLPVPQGPGIFSHVYLYPPSEGADMGGGGAG
jgi:opacity protein-like surface antigen